MLKLNTPVSDIATGLSGRLTHMSIELGGARFYVFQVTGLSHEDLQPIPGAWLPPQRIQGAIEIPDPEVVDESFLGSLATDAASGFTGTVVGITLHTNGCVHLTVQPKGIQPKSGAQIKACDFDLRRLTGPKIPVFTEEALVKSQRERPSPEGHEAFHPTSSALGE